MLTRAPFLAVWLLMLALCPSPASSQDASVQAPSPARAAPYRINAGDELEIYVWGEQRLQRNVKVLPDGTIAFPLVGQVVVQGLLPQELEARITEGLRDQYNSEVPQVTVSVTAPAGMQFSVIGRVKSPGTFTPGRYVNVLEGLSMAGGPNEFANLENVIIIRKVGEQLQTLRIRLAELFRGSVNRDMLSVQNIARLESGDTVVVP